MINLLTRAACTLLIIWTLWGCGQEVEKTAKPPHTPATAEKVEKTEQEEQLIDALGRLVPAKSKIDGFPLPKMATEETEQGAPSRSFRVRALQRTLLKFYMHRDFHVVKLHKGHRIQHSSITRERNGKDDEGFGTLVITQRKQRDQHLRFIPGKAPKVHVPEVNREVLREERDNWTPEAKKTVEAAVKKAPPKKAVQRKRIVVPFNPGVPRSLGTRNTRKEVKEWLKKNPGTVFYD